MIVGKKNLLRHEIHDYTLIEVLYNCMYIRERTYFTETFCVSRDQRRRPPFTSVPLSGEYKHKLT